MSDSDGDRAERLRSKRQQAKDKAQTSKTSKTVKTEKTEETDQPSKTERTSVKDRPSVLMYLPEEVHSELDIRFAELNAAAKRERGEAIEKNRDFYPTLVELALERLDEMDDEEIVDRLGE